jgi:hypothetical protein
MVTLNTQTVNTQLQLFDCFLFLSKLSSSKELLRSARMQHAASRWQHPQRERATQWIESVRECVLCLQLQQAVREGISVLPQRTTSPLLLLLLLLLLPSSLLLLLLLLHILLVLLRSGVTAARLIFLFL